MLMNAYSCNSDCSTTTYADTTVCTNLADTYAENMSKATAISMEIETSYDHYCSRSEVDELINHLKQSTNKILTNKEEEKDKESIMKKSIIKVEVIVPNKVVEVTFADGQKEKMICHEEDVFDLRTCLFIAMAKHLYKKTLIYEGIEHKAKELMYEKESVKIVNSALKEFRKNEEFVESEKRRIEEEKETAKRKKEKLIERKKRRREKKEAAERERLIEIQTEAYVRAMKLMETRGA